MFTIDTSVFVADLTPTESGYAESRALLDRLRADGTPLILPTLLLVELAGVIGRVHGDPERAWRVVANLSTNPQATFVALDETLALRAADLAAGHRLRGADAVMSASRNRRAAHSSPSTQNSCGASLASSPPKRPLQHCPRCHMRRIRRL